MFKPKLWPWPREYVAWWCTWHIILLWRIIVWSNIKIDSSMWKIQHRHNIVNKKEHCLSPNCDLDLWSRWLDNFHDTSSCYKKQVSWKSYHALWRCGAGQCNPIKQYSFWFLISKCDLDICVTGPGLVRDTRHGHGECLCQVSWKSYDAWLRCNPDKVTLSNSTYFDLWPLSVTLIFEVQALVLCQVSFKSYDACVRCGLVKVRWDWQTDRLNRPNL